MPVLAVGSCFLQTAGAPSTHHIRCVAVSLPNVYSLLHYLSITRGMAGGLCPRRWVGWKRRYCYIIPSLLWTLYNNSARLSLRRLCVFAIVPWLHLLFGFKCEFVVQCFSFGRLLCVLWSNFSRHVSTTCNFIDLSLSCSPFCKLNSHPCQ